MITSVSAGIGLLSALALLGFGAYSTVKTNGFALGKFPKILRILLRADKDKRKAFRAFTTSLAGTVGVGNMTGVAVAIAAGGAGAVFWMWVSALLCTTVKYFEIRLATKHQPQEESEYGFAPIVYLRKATGSRIFAALFSVFGIFSALTMGNMVQTNAACDAAREGFGYPSAVIGILFAAGLGLLTVHGPKQIMKLSERLIPPLGIAFPLLGVVVIACHFREILPSLRQIFTEAFSFSAAGGGLLGTGIAKALRYGVGNGLFSHEAGLGSAGFAHGLGGSSAETQGFWGIFEVAADTLLISTISALMILTTDTDTVLSAAQSTLGAVGRIAVAGSLILFAFLSVLSWEYYGETCFVRLCGKKSAPVFRILYLTAPLLAVFLPGAFLWEAAEITNGIMMMLNLTGLWLLRKDLVNPFAPKQKETADTERNRFLPKNNSPPTDL